MYFSAGIILPALRILNSFIKSFVNPFVDMALTFFDNSFNSFLFKFVFFTKLAISLLLAKFACFSLAIKPSDVNL